MASAHGTGALKVAKKKEPKATIYVEVPASLKARFERIAEAHGRKLNAEMFYALTAYCDQQEAELGLNEEQE